MHNDAKIGILTTVFIGLISLLVLNQRMKFEASETGKATWAKRKKDVYQFRAGTSASSIKTWLQKNKLDYQITTRKDRNFLNNAIFRNSKVPARSVQSYIYASTKTDGYHGYQFLFDWKGNLIKAWAEDYSPGVKSNYSP